MEDEAMATKGRRDHVKAVANRLFLAVSGRSVRAYSIVRHVGRVTGREYRNPVSAYPLDDGFVIAVLYGPRSQWVRNIMATGHLVLRTKGRDHRLERPEFIGQEQALVAFPPYQRRMLTRRGIRDFVWAHHAGATPASR
jgi:hypothetical protein